MSPSTSAIAITASATRNGCVRSTSAKFSAVPARSASARASRARQALALILGHQPFRLRDVAVIADPDAAGDAPQVRPRLAVADPSRGSR
jgi:hypothetical protein